MGFAGDMGGLTWEGAGLAGDAGTGTLKPGSHLDLDEAAAVAGRVSESMDPRATEGAWGSAWVGGEVEVWDPSVMGQSQ